MRIKISKEDALYQAEMTEKIEHLKRRHKMLLHEKAAIHLLEKSAKTISKLETQLRDYMEKRYSKKVSEEYAKLTEEIYIWLSKNNAPAHFIKFIFECHEDYNERVGKQNLLDEIFGEEEEKTK